MGSDSPPFLLYDAVLQAAKDLPVFCSFLVIALPSVIKQISQHISQKSSSFVSRIEFYEAEQVITMDDEAGSVRYKKKSSMVIGLRLLKEGRLDALISCGNTGALIAGSTVLLPRLPGIIRPALLVSLPAVRGFVSIIDVGSTVSSKAPYLIQFAYLGAAYQRAWKGKVSPKVALLNVGVESKKGTLEVREAYDYLKKYVEDCAAIQVDPGMDFVGNREGRDIFRGDIDVLVTDGFTGNVFLKTAEGVADFIFGALEQEEGEKKESFLGSLLRLKKSFNYAEYPGALVCGVEGVVVKVHGTGLPQALLNSILGAFEFVEKQIISKMKQELSKSKA